MSILKTKAGRGAALGLAYLAFAFALTYPLMLHLGSFVEAGGEDGSMSIWNLWWMKYSIFHLHQNPLDCNYLYFPEGVNLIFHSIPKFLGLISVPFQYLAGLGVAYNIIYFGTFIATGLTTYWLVYHLLGERLPAFLAGAFFTFSPYHIDQRAHLQLMSIMLIPLFVLLVIKGREALPGGGRRPWVYFGLAGVAMGVQAYDTEYFSIFLIIFSAIYFLYYFPVKWSRVELNRWGLLLLGLIVAGLIFALLYLPLLIAAAGEIAARGDFVTFPAIWTQKYASDLIEFITPYHEASLLGPAFQHYSNFFTLSDTTFLGWTALVLAGVGAVRYRRRRDTWLWVLVAAIFAALALGPHVTYEGSVKNIPGPYLLLTKIPIIDSARVPGRFGVIAMFAVAILAGYGASALFAWLRRLAWSWFTVPTVAGIILTALFLEVHPGPSIVSVEAPSVYGQIAASGVPGSVITLPMGWEAGNDTTGDEHTFVEVFQATHERPLVGGMVARAPKDDIFRGIYTPVIDFLADPVHLAPAGLDFDPAAIARFQQRYDVAFIVVQKTIPPFYHSGGSFGTGPTDMTPEALVRVDKYVTRYLGMEKFADTADVVAYRRR